MGESAASRGLGFGPTLRNRHFRSLWIAQVISQTIQNAINYGSIVLLANQSNSFTAVGGVVVAFSLPAVLFGIPAGVVVDRFDKRAVLWISNALRAVGAFGFVISLLVNNTAFVPIYLLTFFISIVGQFFGPAEGATIPLLVGEDEVIPALSLFNITFSIAQALGLVMLGPLIVSLAPTVIWQIGTMTLTLTSMHWLFLFIGVMYLVCTGLIMTIPAARFIGAAPPPSAAPAQRRLHGVWSGVKETAIFVRADRKLLIAIMQMTLGGIVISVIAVIAPLFAVQFLGLPTSLATVVFVPAGVGLIAGSTLMPRIIDRLGLALAEALGIIGVAASALLITFGHWIAARLHLLHTRPYLAIIMLLIFMIGLSLDLVTLPAQTTMQRHTPDWIKGRVLALQVMVFNAASIPIILTIGPVADLFGLPVAINLLGAGVAALGLASIYLSEGRAALHATRDGMQRISDGVRRGLGTAAVQGREILGEGHQKTRQGHDASAPSLLQRHDAEETGTPSRPLPLR